MSDRLPGVEIEVGVMTVHDLAWMPGASGLVSFDTFFGEKKPSRLITRQATMNVYMGS
ncbi:MAG: hypothetical protein Q7U34_05140 [Anaerolineales bacterium]|nr:hypothetical protein [Anaerolineales bacterium]